jgi:hypothetical protein
MRGWIYDCFDWFDEAFDAPPMPILPTKAFFSAPSGSGVETAKIVLDDIKRLMNFGQEVEILPLDVVPAELRHSYQATSEIAGTFQVIDGVATIRYDPEKMNQPVEFINLLAHELMHARLNGLEDQVPGGVGAHELATDLGCIIAGFGTFQLQAADDLGWSGYMSQQSRAFALAVFLERRGLELGEVKPFLSSRCAKLVSRARREL